MKKPSTRRLLDLTPLLDVIMILLFGAMIHSVELTKVATSEARAEVLADRASLEDWEDAQAERERLQALLAQSEAQRASRQRRLDLEKSALMQTLARLVGLNEEDRAALEERIRRLAEAPPEDLGRVLDELSEQNISRDLVLGLRRIQEMQKVFTFIDLHIDDRDFLSVENDAGKLARFSVRDQDEETIRQRLRRILEAVSFKEVVLILFSYEGDAYDRSVETAEVAINKLVASYRQEPAQERKQFRLGRVGLVRSTQAER